MDRVADVQADIVVAGVDNNVVGGVGYLLLTLCLGGAGDTEVGRLMCPECLLFICLEIFFLVWTIKSVVFTIWCNC